jgi:PKD repeat protein
MAYFSGAQSTEQVLAAYLGSHQTELGISTGMVRSGWRVSDEHTHRGVTFAYVQQTINGLPLQHAVSTAAIRQHRVESFVSRFLPNVPATAAAMSAKLDVYAAVSLAAADRNLSYSPQNGAHQGKRMVFPPIVGDDAVSAYLSYWNSAEGIRLVWSVSLPTESDWWLVHVDAATGKVAAVENYTVHCLFDKKGAASVPSSKAFAEAPVVLDASYRVIPFPGESPQHAPFEWLSNPSDSLASPLGWHDTDGIAGPEFTITRGNNTHVYEDQNDDNEPGYSPDGETDLVFDFPFSADSSISHNASAAMVNLFYAANTMHDLTYHYGFNEAAGNFQTNNYGRGGIQDDYVRAEAQDGSGTNNANFSTPPDGERARMQMYIWNPFNPSGVRKDCSFDNGIIAHEFGHGVSNRLTGGPSVTNCLRNEEQMGEGWSDFYSLITTLQTGDSRTDLRPVGTFALGEPVDGPGIRNKVYTTDISVNNHTYADMPSTGGRVHDIGEIWAIMLWDLTWDLIDVYGFDPDRLDGKGGNNIAQQLVTDGLKLQPCEPGFVDGRDAILMADKLFYNSANECLIWGAFARRGLGWSAQQGSTDDFTDGVAAFDIPPPCRIATEAPLADFTVDQTRTCLAAATFQFLDSSQQVPQYWLWDFGDGSSSDEISPRHTYQSEGTYTVTLIVRNSLGADTLVRENYVVVAELPAPQGVADTACVGGTATLTAAPNVAGNGIEWLGADGVLAFSGSEFITPPLSQSTYYFVREIEPSTPQLVGPGLVGAGGFHNSSVIGKILFTAETAFTLKSALVRALGSSNRTIYLYDEAGNVLQTYTVAIPSGQGRVDLNIQIPGAGNYALGAGPNAKLFRSSDNISYPYNLAGVVSITGQEGGQDDFYFYFYEWEVQKANCVSLVDTVMVAVKGPEAVFSYLTNNGTLVRFTDESTGSPTTWFWEFGDGATSTDPSPEHQYTAPLAFEVALTVSDGICTHTRKQTLDLTTGSRNISGIFSEATLFPNPANEKLVVGLPSGREALLSLWSADGRLIWFDKVQGGQLINILPLPAGIYAYRFWEGNDATYQTLIIQH